MKTMILVLYLMSGHIARVEKPEPECREIEQIMRSGARVTATDARGRVHEVERAQCVEKPALSARLAG